MKKEEGAYGIQATPGNPRLPGVTKENDSYNFSCAIPDRKPASLLLYKKGSCEIETEIPLPVKERTGEMAAVRLTNLSLKDYEYNYKIDNIIYPDNYADLLIGKSAFGQPDDANPHTVRCRFVEEEFPWEGDECLYIPFEDMILYKLHVRGYTMQKASRVRYKGTFQGLQLKIPHLKELGITSVELMPCYEFDEIIKKEEFPTAYAYQEESCKVNYWGYSKKAYYFAPKASYSATGNPVREFKELVRAFHQAGIECIMEFYVPVNMDPLLVLAAVRNWKLEYHIDGFHMLGEGVPQDLLIKDPLLAETKLLFMNVNGQMIYKNNSSDYKYLAEYNEGFRENMRCFLKGDDDKLNEFALYNRRNPTTHGVINYMSIQDGFTMMDMVSYNWKHNEKNGEDNRDGTNYNYSWNCGIEGPSRKLSVRALRKQQIRNSFLFLLLSQGVPLLYQGDEICNSQNGNNNAYCQDNETGWVDWTAAKRNQDMISFVKEAAAFRRKHPVLHMKKEPRVMDYKTLGYPDLSYHTQRAWFARFKDNAQYLGVMYCGAYAKTPEGESDDFIYIAYNMHWQIHEFGLPHLPEGKNWYLAADTGMKMGTGFYPAEEQPLVKAEITIQVSPRTILILEGK